MLAIKTLDAARALPASAAHATGCRVDLVALRVAMRGLPAAGKLPLNPAGGN